MVAALLYEMWFYRVARSYSPFGVHALLLAPTAIVLWLGEHSCSSCMLLLFHRLLAYQFSTSQGKIWTVYILSSPQPVQIFHTHAPLHACQSVGVETSKDDLIFSFSRFQCTHNSNSQYVPLQLFKSKAYNRIASLPTIMISALFHEYVLWAPLRSVMPVLLIQYGAFGGKPGSLVLLKLFIL